MREAHSVSEGHPVGEADTVPFRHTVCFAHTVGFADSVPFGHTVQFAQTVGFADNVPFGHTVRFAHIVNFADNVPFGHNLRLAQISVVLVLSYDHGFTDQITHPSKWTKKSHISTTFFRKSLHQNPSRTGLGRVINLKVARIERYEPKLYFAGSEIFVAHLERKLHTIS